MRGRCNRSYIGDPLFLGGINIRGVTKWDSSMDRWSRERYWGKMNGYGDRGRLATCKGPGADGVHAVYWKT